MTHAADPWQQARAVIGSTRVLAGPQLSSQIMRKPEHLAFVLFRYRAAAALIGQAQTVLEIGCGEGIGAGILARGREAYFGTDTDDAALAIAQETHPNSLLTRFANMGDLTTDLIATRDWLGCCYDAAVLIDVIEHVPARRVPLLMQNITENLTTDGVCVVGTPSKCAEAYASPESRAGHVNLYTPERLRDVMVEHFDVVQMLYSQDTSLHLGHPQMAHYLIAVGIGPRT